ncbi:MAG: serine/threonine protein kinase, partial [Oscillospiraceae bacterium]|nr:serine/threonine protein kinase [Oscillospiraceae bacterium]
MSEMNTPAHQLPAGTQLSDKYEIIRTIGEGGFGITYMGRNTVLDIPVAIKEYYPNGFANRSSAHDLAVTITDNTKNSYFSKWKEKFLNEARILAKFSNIPNIVNVLDFFEQNGTAYIVMEYLNGVTLSNYVSSNGVFSADKLCRMMIPMLKSLDRIHQEKLIHRDISPDNIMVMSDGTLKLYDFGAARDYSGTSQKSLSVMLKPGFAPEEQYRSRGIQGPWTDVYAVCATMYYCITGIKPDDSIQRVFSDELKPPSELGIRIPPPIETAILMGMSIKAEDRFRTAEA